MTLLASTPPKPPRAVPCILLSKREAARSLAISPALLDQLIARGEIPSRRISRRRMFLPSELRQWAEALPSGGVE